MFDVPLGGATLASWGPDDTLAFGVYPAGMWRVPAGGGSHQEVPVVDPSKNERWGGYPEFLPGGNVVAYGFRTKDVDSFDDYNIAAYSFETRTRKILIESGMVAHYLPPGHLIYIRGGALYAAPFDAGQLAVTGPPVMVQDGVYQSHVTVVSQWAVSANGSLAYAPGGLVGGGRRLVWANRQGKVQPVALPPRAYLHPRISPDARQIAIEVEGPNHNVYLYDLNRGTFTKMTFDGSSHSPLWTPDGKRLTYRVGMPGPFKMWAMPADRSGAAEQLTTIGQQQSAASWSPDGRTVAFTQVSAETAGDIYTLDMSSDRKPRVFAQSKFDEGSPRFSPDGRWIAYCSNESGRKEIYVQAYPGPGPKIQVSVDGGSDPVWKRNGGELYYRNGDKMMAVTVVTGSTFTASKPKLLWEAHYNQGLNSMCGAPGPTSSNYDVTADGQRFLMIQEGDEDAPATEIRVVLNWSEELKRLTGAKKD
jgi:dipeptidyl aminopeptidase/acylaminoacyl peptidase